MICLNLAFKAIVADSATEKILSHVQCCTSHKNELKKELNGKEGISVVGWKYAAVESKSKRK